MTSRGLLFAAAAVFLGSGPALAGKAGLRSGRTTPMEMREARKKALEQMREDGFTPIPMIVGGNPASEGEYPWMAALVQAEVPDNYDGQFCGGTLIHPSWILTAGHCVFGSRAEDIHVVLGATDLGESSGIQRIEVAEIILAPGYNNVNLDSDFALLRLKEPADSSFTSISVVDDASLANPGVVSTVIGWGDTTNGEGEYPERLQEVQLPIVDLAVANASPDYNGTLSANMLAAGYAQGGKDSCSGDSGGPLMVPSPVGPGFAQAGVVSFGVECAAPGTYGIYTKVGNYRHFVTGHLRPNYAQWEARTGRVGESRDPDGNGLSNFEDFAFPSGSTLTQQTVSGTRRFSFVRPTEADEVEYILENAPSAAGPWTRKEPGFISSQVLDEFSSTWTVGLPEAGLSGVFRIRAAYSNAVVNGMRPLAYTSSVKGTLDQTDDLGPGGAGHSRRYALESLPVGSESRVTLRSNDFDATLRLVNAAMESVLQTSSNGSAGGNAGQDEALAFTAQAGVRYMVEVISDNAGGEFEISIWNPTAFASVPGLTIPYRATAKKPLTLTTKGSLTTGDGIDPQLQPGPPYYKDDFIVDPSLLPARQVVELRMKSGKGAMGIDDYLALIDAESGQVLMGNDDFAGKSNDAGIRFMPVPGRSYLLRLSSAQPEDIGNYSLSATAPKLTSKTPLATVTLGSTVTGKLAGGSELDEAKYTAKRDYLLQPLPAGQEISVTLASKKFDAVIVVFDAGDLSVVAQGDGGGPVGGVHNARATFTTKAGQRYLIRATTYREREAGSYTLAIAPNS
ncbi:S1 family serine peptidase [Luteolibacter luteus]|uniref:Serine protease n=1 Tax=Luteolibacter luteus TaxID=2728835 RepID=A0A858RLR6_9BACT|nr:serine protease [Luteolibacter luteus]QJE97408.1 serine protease [Luteolibacter luteus]